MTLMSGWTVFVSCVYSAWAEVPPETSQLKKDTQNRKDRRIVGVIQAESERHLHGSEDGRSVHLVVTAAALIVEDLLRVRLPAQQLQFAQRHFRHADEPLNRRLLLLPALWNTTREKRLSSGSLRTSAAQRQANCDSPSPNSRTTLATYGLSSSSPSMRMCWPVLMTKVLGRPSTLMAKELVHKENRKQMLEFHNKTTAIRFVKPGVT